MSTEPTHDSRSSRRWVNTSSWAVGAVFILLGIIFVVQNVTGFTLHNWWALFILIPAVGSFATAYQMWERNDRRLTAATHGPLWGGVMLLAVMAIFLFGLDWGRIWPLFLILIGVGAILGAFRGQK